MKPSVKRKPTSWVKWPLWLTPILIVWLISARATTLLVEPQEDYSDHACLRCHGSSTYTFADEKTGESITMKMYEELRIDPKRYAKATHGHFSCTDCHSPDYEIHPHPVSVKFEVRYSCMDCHANDQHFADFHFETIEKEFSSSVHAEHLIPRFSCWSCHNPHTYRSTVRTQESIVDLVAYNNSMCLGCHGDISHYAVIIENQLTNMLSKHDWLPNQSLHFRKVRCIDCHAQVNKDILVAHHVKPADEAVKNCVDCHSTNSILLASLYKHQIIERRNKYGFFNASITGDAYIIGANRNYYFNLISVVIFGMVLAGIALHATLRYLKYRRGK